jgi:hypothetical protein
LTDDLIEELRKCSLCLLVVESPSLIWHADGSVDVIASSEESLLAAMEHLTFQGVRVTQCSEEFTDSVVVVMTEGWKTGPRITKSIAVAQRTRTPLYFLNPISMKLVRACS